MDSYERRKRIYEKIEEERAEGEHGWWYVSFLGNEGWRGATIVQGYGVVSACWNAAALGINPGGEAMAVQVPESFSPPPEDAQNRLLKYDDLVSLGLEPVSLDSFASEEDE